MKRATLIASLVIPCSCTLAPAFAGPVTGLTTFTSGTPAKASEMNGNFNAVKTAVDDNDSRVTKVESDLQSANSSTQAALASQDQRILALENPPDPRELLAYGANTTDANLSGASMTWSGNNVATYHNLTITAGSTLNLPSGVTIRCSGTFVNNGTIVVQKEARGGLIGAAVAGLVPTMAPPDSGDTAGGTAFPAYDLDGTFSSALAGGTGGQPPARARVVSNLNSLQSGGGGGGGVPGGAGGRGGGVVRIYASGAITNTGAIVADGEPGYGGGGGGLVALASNTSIENSGSISVRGGEAIASSTTVGANAGGGGGAVLLIAPAVTAGTIDIAAGVSASGSAGVSSTASRAGGGSGGAGMGGAGGTGGSVSGTVSAEATSGAVGFTLTIEQNPLEAIVP